MTYTRMTYCGNLVYENDTLKQVLIDGGYVTFNGTTPQYHFYVQDHLGNNRVVCNASGTIEQVNHYYPYGGLMGESEDITSTQRYKYNGKELDRMHGLNWYDYHARQYDASVGKFTTMDPLCEKYYNVSPYAYCVGNPVNYVDPDGREWTDLDGNVIDDLTKIKVFIFYSHDFTNQAQVQYNTAIEKYGKGTVAMSVTSTTEEFAKDWGNMGGKDIANVMIMTHGKNQSITLDEKGREQFTSTGDGKTNISHSDAPNVQDLPIPKGDISNAVLKMYSCHSADTAPQKHGEGVHAQGELKGDPIAYTFVKSFNFRGVMGTSESVNYHSFFTDGTPKWSENYLKPYPANGGRWKFLIRK